MIKVVGTREEEIPVSLYPDSVIEEVEIVKPSHYIRVKGQVSELNPYPKRSPSLVYGTLKGLKKSIAFKCTLEDAPQVKQDVILGGWLRFNYDARSEDGHCQVLLDVKSVDNWQRPQDAYSAKLLQHIAELQSASTISLAGFARKYGFSKLGVAGTRTAIQDYETAIANAGSSNPCISLVTKANDIDSVIQSAAELIESNNVLGIAFIRGGGDGLGIWDDPELVYKILEFRVPFYSAIGHASNVSLLDKHSDEQFSTPTMFGSRVAEIFQALEHQDGQSKAILDLKNKASQLEHDNKNIQTKLKSDFSDQAGHYATEIAKLRKTKNIAIGLLVLILTCITGATIALWPHLSALGVF